MGAGDKRQPLFRPLKQRISFRTNLQPLNPKEVKEYIKRRLRVAGARSTYLFIPKALKKIYHYSKRIRQLINIVYDNALIYGFGSEKQVIGDDIVQEVISDLADSPRSKFKIKIKEVKFFCVLAVVLLGIVAFYFWGPGNVLDLLKGFWAKAWEHLNSGMREKVFAI